MATARLRTPNAPVTPKERDSEPSQRTINSNIVYSAGKDVPTFTLTSDGDAFSSAVDRLVGAYKWCRRSPIATNYIVLAVVSLAVRLYRIGTPDGVVFDEYHFGKFVNNYFDGQYFFDIHPPLGKLTLAFFGLLT